jgi:hypothetical protein
MLLQTTLDVRNKHTMNKSKPLNSEINIINIYGRFDHNFFYCLERSFDVE